MKTLIILALASATLTGCASIVSGSNQSLSVTTAHADADVVGARCTVSNDKGTWFVTTPGSVMVHRSFNDLALDCRHADHGPGLMTVKSATKGMAFGNILLGGVIGAGVDMSTGAAYDYPGVITVQMDAVVGDAAQAKAANTDPATYKPVGKVYCRYETMIRDDVCKDSAGVQVPKPLGIATR